MRWVANLFGGLVILIILLWPGTANVPEQGESSLKGEGLYRTARTTANQGIFAAKLYQTENGKKRWRILSKFTELHRKEDYAFMEEVDADFFAEKTGNVVNTQSDYGRTSLGKRRVDLEGNVRIRSKRGYLFTMPRLAYEGEGHLFTTEDEVSMKGPNLDRPTMILDGKGLSGDIDSEHFILKRNVTALKKLKGNGWYRSTSRSGEFFTDAERAVFIGKVHAVLPNVTLDGDLLEMSLAEEEETMLARGDVKLKTGNRVGWADSAFLETGSNKIVLSGKAKIVSKENEVKGKKIVLYTDEDRVEVVQAEGSLRD